MKHFDFEKEYHEVGYDVVVAAMRESNEYVAFRAGWNGKGMFVFKRKSSELTNAAALKITTIDEDVLDVLLAKNKKDKPLIFTESLSLRTAQGTVVNGWIASMSDTLANDWSVVKANTILQERLIPQNQEKQLIETQEEVNALEYSMRSKIDDGYHSFNELYAHRHLLFLNFAKSPTVKGWCSKLHADGTSYVGYFVAGIDLPAGTITYHLPNEFWEIATSILVELDNAPEFDGASSFEVLERLKKNLQNKNNVVLL